MLNQIDLSQRYDRTEYRKRLQPLQEKLLALQHELYRDRRALICVFEGWDAAGKGGAIRRVTRRLDGKGSVVHSIGVPEGDDSRHHYLWRFWRRLQPPREKQVQIFDRSWYGRVLVERVEGFAKPGEWQRAYREINDFERQLVEAGMILGKFWLHISPEEQLRRFEARQVNPAKAWKLTDDDWRNREKWPLYEQAVEEMLAKTSTPHAPWTVVAGNNKRFARVQVVATLVEALEKEFGAPAS